MVTDARVYFQPLHDVGGDSPVRSHPLAAVAAVVRRRSSLRPLGAVLRTLASWSPFLSSMHCKLCLSILVAPLTVHGPVLSVMRCPLVHSVGRAGHECLCSLRQASQPHVHHNATPRSKLMHRQGD